MQQYHFQKNFYIYKKLGNDIPALKNIMGTYYLFIIIFYGGFCYIP